MFSRTDLLLARAEEAARMGCWERRLDADEELWSDNMFRLFGYQPGDATPSWTLFRSHLHPEDEALFIAALEKSIRDGRPYDIEYRFVRKDGEVRNGRSNGFVDLDVKGRPWRISGITKDVSEEKAAITALQESEERFRKLSDVGLMGVGVGRPDKGLVEFNDAFCEMLGYTRRELMEKSWDELTHPDDLAEDQRLFDQMLAGDLPGYTMEKRYFRKNGAVLHARISVVCLRRPDGSAKETFGIMQDISEQKRLELALREHQRRLEETLAAQASALDEKEALLREINHRVKNNLQVLISMLRLQAQRDAREGVSEALNDATQRVRAMALVHEILYCAPSLAQIELCEYVSDLVRGLRGTIDHGSGIVISVDVETGILLDADGCVTCGMVLNELITNAIKHAFPHGKGGRIAVKGRRLADGRVRVTVQDNGVGLRKDIDWRHAESLGFTLVVGLVETQLEGEIVREEGDAAAFSFIFRDVSPTANE